MSLHPAALLNASQSQAADQAAIKNGIPSLELMEKAGRAVTDVICECYPIQTTLILCGIGNNGGDGFAVARLLADRGWPVTVCLHGDNGDMKEDAVHMRGLWEQAGGKTYIFDPELLDGKSLIVDALYGTGLSRDLKAADKELVAHINNSKLPVVAVDIASGVDSTTGAIKGVAIRAAHTVSFVRPKMGHVLLPGKEYAGQLHVFDIGISGDDITPDYWLNIPALWREHYPFPTANSHKYSRGHAFIIGAPLASIGASRLCAQGALRAGAGLVSVACEPDTIPAYALTLTAIMTKPYQSDQELDSWLGDEHVRAFCIGPGAGATEKTRERVVQLLKYKKPCVIDADGLSAFKNGAKILFDAIKGPTVLTPHEGEFTRLFKHEGSRIQRAQAAAKESGSVIVLKGNDTIIASPDGRVAINAEAPVWLATAGSGDVLAGIITGLLAQSMPAFEAACAGVWLHSRAASHFGPGLIAEDIPSYLPKAIKDLY
ncbi:MAG: NAD(P)H-hydrate dehydratase [Rickettsiales bacterium]|nr:NAD(P)H-hydrate dehydratase [Rickettsiales bacterium]